MTCKECLHFDACITIFKEACPNTTDKELDKIASRQQISRTCPAFKNKADFIGVVRCKDCDVPHNRWLGCPNLNGLIPPPNFYCARGERKDGAGE